MNWMNEIDSEIAIKIREAGNHVIVVPAQNSSAPIDSFDVFNGVTKEYIAVDVSEKSAQELATIWNGLLDGGEKVDTIRKINLSWLTGSVGNRYAY